MLKDYFILAIRNLRKRKMRTWLTMLGIFISIATIFLLISLSLGLQGVVEEQFRILGTDKLFILPGTGFLGPPGSVGGVILTENDINTIKKIKGVKDYTYATIGNAKIEYNNEIKYVQVIGIPLEKIGIFTETGAWKIEKGKELKEKGSGKILIGYLYGQGEVFKKPINPGNKILINEKRFEVQGITSQVGNSQDDSIILMSLDEFRELFNISERIDEIIVQADEGENILDLGDRIEKRLLSSRGVTEKTKDFDITTPEKLLEQFQTILNIITAFLAGIAAISLFVGGVGIANTMYTSVLERTREIGVMKAIGAQNKDIMMIFLIESGLLGLVGGIIGVLLGIGAGKFIEYIAINNLNTNLLKISIPLYLVAGCLLFAFFVGALSGVLPARQASKTSVVDALRYE